jgi:hypothetical protein
MSMLLFFLLPMRKVAHPRIRHAISRILEWPRVRYGAAG